MVGTLRPGNNTSTRFPTNPSICSDVATDFKNSVADVNVFSMSFKLNPLAVSSRNTPVNSGTFLNVPLLNTSLGCSSMKPGRDLPLAGDSTTGP